MVYGTKIKFIDFVKANVGIYATSILPMTLSYFISNTVAPKSQPLWQVLGIYGALLAFLVGLTTGAMYLRWKTFK